MNTESDSSSEQASSANKIWNHTTPVVFSALFDWPPRPYQAFLAITKRWVTITRNCLFLILAVCTYLWLVPELSSMQTFSLNWIVPIFVRNFALFLVISGGLHWYLFIYRGQGKKLKYDTRESMPKSPKFSFRNQVHDNMFWTLGSGTTIWTLYEVLYFYAAANGIVPNGAIPIANTTNPVWGIIAWLIVMPVLLSSHFYLIHRLLHWPPLFNRYHKLHHRNIHIGPWSGMSMHPVEHLFYLSSVLIHFVIPTHPIIVILHLYMRSLAPSFSHAGFEKLIVRDKTVTDAADFHHQLHHRYFECNYGNVDAPWDRWFGSLHDGSDEATTRIAARRKEMYRQRTN